MRKITSTNFENEKFLEYDCPFITTLRFIGKRWKPAVLWKINQGYIRFKLLKQVLPLISDKMLSATIREMETDGIIQKEVFDEVPLRVEYKLTEFGKELLPILKEMNEWGMKTIEKITSHNKV
ncbi:winged helix-turn-helix transcriptional regulator [Aquimarina litoralis]|uniref:winged helix-turn-helix transcriptional regulator n=1 Tax=Aquimarina litoralis TaxID=584605 RepID=UPI001C58C800|nr:helix-turn-helix domain-containing protein [Aquimarina litoralis]MBW1294823.1 transcriptional regulator [Aquimarina litoralis]